MRIVKSVLLLTVLISVSATSALAADFFGFSRHKGVDPVVNDIYAESCGECHFAYQPGLLPSRSWKKMMLPESLEDHFGENAELPEADRIEVLNFLVTNAAETTWRYKRSIKINRSVPESEAPLRIIETPYIRKKHSDIPRRMIQDNPKVRGLSYCNRCHTAADKGVYDNDTVNIPNFPDWDDLID